MLQIEETLREREREREREKKGIEGENGESEREGKRESD